MIRRCVDGRLQGHPLPHRGRVHGPRRPATRCQSRFPGGAGAECKRHSGIDAEPHRASPRPSSRPHAVGQSQGEQGPGRGPQFTLGGGVYKGADLTGKSVADRTRDTAPCERHRRRGTPSASRSGAPAVSATPRPSDASPHFDGSQCHEFRSAARPSSHRAHRARSAWVFLVAAAVISLDCGLQLPPRPGLADDWQQHRSRQRRTAGDIECADGMCEHT